MSLNRRPIALAIFAVCVAISSAIPLLQEEAGEVASSDPVPEVTADDSQVSSAPPPISNENEGGSAPDSGSDAGQDDVLEGTGATQAASDNEEESDSSSESKSKEDDESKDSDSESHSSDEYSYEDDLPGGASPSPPTNGEQEPDPASQQLAPSGSPASRQQAPTIKDYRFYI